MLEADTLLMNRALELAKRGAGLVSPNPMVGAVLVREGRLVGEGFHRYDLLRHAESYAIEQAGELARSATLFCNLEPCCHHGRTPPCTEAIIEAGIARVIVAVKDPDQRVNGRGVERLRDAGIEVDTGLLEDEAVRLNESYFKFITRGTPFVHGIIEYRADSSNRSEWNPSNEFLRAFSQYDAVMIGSRPELNRSVVYEAFRRERHRALVVAASSEEPGMLESLRRRVVRNITVVPFETESDTVEAPGKVVRIDEGIGYGAARSQLGALLAKLGRMQVTSLLALPGVFDLTDPSNFKELDKATLVIPRSMSEQRLATHWAFGDIEFALDDVSISEADGYAELTGYPSFRGAA